MFLLIFVLMSNGKLIKFDNSFYKFIYSIGTYDFFKTITFFGSAFLLIFFTLLLYFVIKNKKTWISVIFNLCIVNILNFILKIIIQRPRPNLKLINVSGYSFPSGHSMISMAFYGYLIYLIYKSNYNKCIKITLILILSLLIILIGISRVYLGVHYISDVLAGFLVSISYLIVYTSLYHKFVGGSK